MNIQLIRETESQNDGSNINLYWNKQIGAWCAYGYSAYGLRLFDKRQGYMNLRSFRLPSDAMYGYIRRIPWLIAAILS